MIDKVLLLLSFSLEVETVSFVIILKFVLCHLSHIILCTACVWRVLMEMLSKLISGIIGGNEYDTKSFLQTSKCCEHFGVQVTLAESQLKVFPSLSTSRSIPRSSTLCSVWKCDNISGSKYTGCGERPS